MVATIPKSVLKNSRPLNLDSWSEEQEVIDAADFLVGQLSKLPKFKKMSRQRKVATRLIVCEAYFVSHGLALSINCFTVLPFDNVIIIIDFLNDMYRY